MKKCFKIMMGLVLAVSLLGFTACGSPEPPPPAAPAPAAAAPVFAPEDIVEIQMVFPISGRPVPPGIGDVFDAINEITGPLIGVHVNPNMIESGVYTAQASMMLVAREPIDMILTMPFGATSFSVAAPQGHFMPMNDLLPLYGQGIIDVLGPLLQGTVIDGNVYAVTGYRSLVQNVYVAMRIDILEELGLMEQAQSIRSVSDLDEIFQIVADNTHLVPLVANEVATVMSHPGIIFDDYFENWRAFDNLGDTLHIIRVDDNGVISNHFASDTYRRSIEIVRDWYERGFVYRDLLIASESAQTYIRNDVGFAYFAVTEIGGDISHSIIAGTPLLFVQVGPGPQITTGNTRAFTWAIPSASREPEGAMRFLDLMFTDARIANLLAYGIEGRDYVLLPNGLAAFPEGLDVTTVPYHHHDHMHGNQFLKHPWYGTHPDLRSMAQAEMERIGASPFLGFSANTDDIQLEIMAVQGVIDQFRRQIESGSASLYVYDEFVTRLEQVGANTIVEEFQRQLDEWLANR